MNILVVDDEKHILELYQAILKSDGHKVFCAENGEEALNVFYENKIDLIIADEMMPKLSGNEFVKIIRKENESVPIIIVTAKGMLEDKQKSFSLGVDDYMVKPISNEELVMRVNALARRSKIMQDKKIVVGDVVLDYQMHTIENAKKKLKVQLTKTEFEILYKLLSYPEKVFTKWQLYEEFWGVNSDTDEGIIKVFISKIRKEIEIFPEIKIETILGVGYKGVKNG